jgi:hypothetical protein
MATSSPAVGIQGPLHDLVRDTTAKLEHVLENDKKETQVPGPPTRQGSAVNLAHWSLQAVLRCFLAVLETMQKVTPDTPPTLYVLEYQLRSLQQICAEIITSGAAQLLIGPHIAALGTYGSVAEI